MPLKKTYYLDIFGEIPKKMKDREKEISFEGLSPYKLGLPDLVIKPAAFEFSKYLNYH